MVAADEPLLEVSSNIGQPSADGPYAHVAVGVDGAEVADAHPPSVGEHLLVGVRVVEVAEGRSQTLCAPGARACRGP